MILIQVIYLLKKITEALGQSTTVMNDLAALFMLHTSGFSLGSGPVVD